MITAYFVKLPYKIPFLKLDCFGIKLQKTFLIFRYSKTQLLTLVSSPLKVKDTRLSIFMIHEVGQDRGNLLSETGSKKWENTHPNLIY